MEYFVITVDGEIRLKNETKKISEIAKLELKFRNNPGFLADCITYLYHTYYYQSVFWPYALSQRKKEVCSVFLNNVDSEKFEEHDEVKTVIKELQKGSGLSQAERFYEGIKQDIEDLKEHFNNIKYTKKIKVDQEVAINIDGIEKSIRLNQMINIDNSAEKVAALKSFDALYTMEQKFKDIIAKERKSNNVQAKKANKTRIFDKI